MTKRLTYKNVCNKFDEFLKSVHKDDNKECTTLVNDEWVTSSLFSDTVGDGNGDEFNTEVVLMELFTDYLAAQQIMWDKGIVCLIIQTAFKNSRYGVTATVLEEANDVNQRYEGERNIYSELEGRA